VDKKTLLKMASPEIGNSSADNSNNSNDPS